MAAAAGMARGDEGGLFGCFPRVWDLVGELVPQVEEHRVRENAGDRHVARARVAHHELHAAHQ